MPSFCLGIQQTLSRSFTEVNRFSLQVSAIRPKKKKKELLINKTWDFFVCSVISLHPLQSLMRISAGLTRNSYTCFKATSWQHACLKMFFKGCTSWATEYTRVAKEGKIIFAGVYFPFFNGYHILFFHLKRMCKGQHSPFFFFKTNKHLLYLYI